MYSEPSICARDGGGWFVGAVDFIPWGVVHKRSTSRRKCLRCLSAGLGGYSSALRGVMGVCALRLKANKFLDGGPQF